MSALAEVVLDPEAHAAAAPEAADPHALGPWGRRLEAACKLAAILGSLVFVALVVMSIASIAARPVARSHCPCVPYHCGRPIES